MGRAFGERSQEKRGTAVSGIASATGLNRLLKACRGKRFGPGLFILEYHDVSSDGEEREKERSYSRDHTGSYVRPRVERGSRCGSLPGTDPGDHLPHGVRAQGSS